MRLACRRLLSALSLAVGVAATLLARGSSPALLPGGRAWAAIAHGFDLSTALASAVLRAGPLEEDVYAYLRSLKMTYLDSAAVPENGWLISHRTYRLTV